MLSRIRFKPQGVIGFMADMLMLPIMYLLQGTLRDSPQRTHRWNNRKLQRPGEITFIKTFPKVKVSGDTTACMRWLGPVPLFHMPIFGGWKNYVVLKPIFYEGEWFVGWYPSDDAIGISLVSVRGPVRVLLGPNPVAFFGITKNGTPIPIRTEGNGEIGKPGSFSHIPLR